MVAVNVATPSGPSLPQPKHEPKLGFFIYLLSFMAVIGGFLFGYDTGIVSAAMLYVPKNQGLAPMGNVWQEVIVSITPGVAGIGALCAGKASERYGRRKVIIGSAMGFVLGAFICSVGISKWILLVGRITLGLATGFSSMIVPIYVGESSPAHLRGRLVSAFQMMICAGQAAANIFAGAFSYIDPVNIGWRLMFGFAAVPSMIQLVGFCFLPESPRWLNRHQTSKECEQVLRRVYNGDEEWIEYEMEEIRLSQEQERRDKAEHGDNHVILCIMRIQTVRRALLVGTLIMSLQQMSGINTIMYYTGTIIKSAGVQDEHTAIWISVGTAAVLFSGTLVCIQLVDKLGRRMLFLGSIFCVLIATSLMGIAFLLINNASAPTLQDASGNEALNIDPGMANFEMCFRKTNCDFCTTAEQCGFCVPEGAESGYCLPKDEFNADTRSRTGPCSVGPVEDRWHTVGNATKYEWAESACETPYTLLPVVLMLFYLFSFGSGYAPLIWVYNSEFYPLWAREPCVAWTTFCNWAFNLLVSLTFLSLSEALSKHGVFFVYAGITAFALVLFYFIIPETKGMSLEEVQTLFMSKEERQKAVENIRLRELPKMIDRKSLEQRK